MGLSMVRAVCNEGVSGWSPSTRLRLLAGSPPDLCGAASRLDPLRCTGEGRGAMLGFRMRPDDPATALAAPDGKCWKAPLRATPGLLPLSKAKALCTHTHTQPWISQFTDTGLYKPA